MRPTAKEYTTEGPGFEGTRTEMRLDPRATKHFMGMFTDMYEDRELAVIRELSTNARDSHVEAGVAHQPIEVSTPSEMDPTFTVTDHGLGLSAEDIAEIYSMYGASTKRESDEQVGMLGIGCKSPLTLSPQFTLSAVKDGRRIVVVVSREEDGGGTMTTVSDEPCADENGVSVNVPITGPNEFDEKAKRFFRFWEPGTVLVNGESPERVDGLWLTDRLLFGTADEPERTPDRYHYRHQAAKPSAYVVMGNVPYPTDPARFNVPDGKMLVAWVDIGEVVFTPAREGLMDAPQTERTLVAIGNRYEAALQHAAQQLVDQADSPKKALEQALRARMELPGCEGLDLGTLSYQGDALPAQHPLNSQTDVLVRFTGGGGRYYYRQVRDLDSPGRRDYMPLKEYTRVQEYEAANWPRTLWVEGYDRDSYTDTQRRKLDRWVDRAGIDQPRAYVLLKGRAPRRWVDEGLVVRWDDVWSIKLTTTVPGQKAKRLAGAYPTWTSGSRTEQTESQAVADHAGPLYYVVNALTPEQAYKVKYSSRWAYTDLRGRVPEERYAAWAAWHASDSLLVALTEQRRARFKELFPRGEEITEVIDREYKKWWKGLTPSERLALPLHTAEPAYETDYAIDSQVLARLPAAQVDDPSLAKLVRACSKADTKALVQVLDRYAPVHEVIDRPGLNGALDEYPILDVQAVQNHPEDALLYVNAAYAARK